MGMSAVGVFPEGEETLAGSLSIREGTGPYRGLMPPFHAAAG